jgi:hypothetical protein
MHLLIIGSGFHRQMAEAFGSGDCGRPSVLASWTALLKAVAAAEKLDGSLITSDHPTHSWERLLLAATAQKSKDTASKSETRLRKAVCTVIREKSKQAVLPQESDFLRQWAGFKGHVVNLNFDHVADQLAGASGQSVVRNADIPTLDGCDKRLVPNLYRRWVAPRTGKHQATFWHPHGTASNASSLRLGLRDYGLQIASYNGAFNQFKEWERKVLERKEGNPIDHDGYKRVRDALEDLDQDEEGKRLKKHDHWITRFMLLPVTIIGAGISDAEIGFHWLLNQRQRNLARIPVKNRPKTYFVKMPSEMSPYLASFREFHSWSEAWLDVLQVSEV